MKTISTKAHGIIDYLIAALLIFGPWMMDFARDGVETWIPVTLGIISLVYSWFTDYETGIVPMMSMKMHVMMDLILGIFLASSPLLFSFDRYVFMPHLILGVLLIATAFYTEDQHYKSISKNIF